MEYPSKVGLITHPTSERNLRERRSGLAHEFLTEHNAPLYDVGHGRLAKAFTESAKKVTLAQADDASEVNRPDIGADVCFNVCCHALLLPRGQATSYATARSRGGAPVLPQSPQ
jgi:hypothetical protein